MARLGETDVSAPASFPMVGAELPAEVLRDEGKSAAWFAIEILVCAVVASQCAWTQSIISGCGV